MEPMRFDASVTQINGIGPKAAEQLAKREIFTVGDLLRFYPASYEEMAEPVQVSEAEPGCFCTFCLTIIGSGSVFRKGSRVITHFEASDGTGKIRLTFSICPMYGRR